MVRDVVLAATGQSPAFRRLHASLPIGRLALHTLRAILRGLEHREVPPPRESAAVYRRFRFMAPGQFKKEQAAFRGRVAANKAPGPSARSEPTDKKRRLFTKGRLAAMGRPYY